MSCSKMSVADDFQIYAQWPVFGKYYWRECRNIYENNTSYS